MTGLSKNSNVVGNPDLLTVLYAERERRRRQQQATPSYTIPERNIQVYGGSKELWESTDSFVCIAGPSDCSKAQPLDATLYTPDGPRLMGDIQVGDIICTPDGGRAPVIAIHPQGTRPIYRITFGEGDSVESDEQHLWLVGYLYEGRKDRGNRYKLMTTRQLLDARLRRGHGKGAAKYWLPRTRPVDFNSRPVPIDPYVLGVLLGDGCTRGNAIHLSSADSEIVEEVRKGLGKNYRVYGVKSNTYDYQITSSAAFRPSPARPESPGSVNSLRGRYVANLRRPGGKYVRRIRNSREECLELVKRNAPHAYSLDERRRLKGIGIWSDLRRLDLMGKLSHQKFVPDIYIYNSVEVRLAILQGLMDTDGTANSTHGGVSFCSTSLTLARNVKFLVESIGGTAKICTHQSKNDNYYHLVLIRYENPAQLFRLTRKKKLAYRSKAIHRRIISVEYVGEKPAQCITVGHKDGLYLTDNLAITHNSYSALHLLDWYCWHHKDLTAVIIRKVHAHMASTIIKDWERKVIKMPKGESIAPGGITKRGGDRPEFYDYPNGSRVWVIGLDQPGKVLSGGVDIAYVCQAEELERDDAETLLTRTSGREGVLKPGRLILDANPGPSTHWIKQKQADGALRLIEAHHTDNPELYDHVTQQWTAEGERRLANLRALTGVLYQRLYLGLWVSAEGTVFQPFALIDRPYADIRYYIGGVDWGWTNPGVIQVWGVDGDDRLYRFVELYQTKVVVSSENADDDTWVKRALELQERFTLRDASGNVICTINSWQCDPARPEFISAFQTAGLNAVAAQNAILQGIQYIETRQKVQADGWPRIALLKGSRGEPDPALVEKHWPTCLEEEVEVYVYPKGVDGKPKKNENPVDAFNHSCDVTRYIASSVDSRSGFFFA